MPNLIGDPSFEARNASLGPYSAYTDGSGTASLAFSSTALSGSYSADISTTATGNLALKAGAATGPLAVVPGTAYSAEGYFYPGSGTPRTYRVGIDFYDGSGTWLGYGYSEVFGAAGSWTWVRTQQTAPAGAAYAVVWFWALSVGAGEHHLLDLVSLAPAAVPLDFNTSFETEPSVSAFFDVQAGGTATLGGVARTGSKALLIFQLGGASASGSQKALVPSRTQVARLWFRIRSNPPTPPEGLPDVSCNLFQFNGPQNFTIRCLSNGVIEAGFTGGTFQQLNTTPPISQNTYHVIDLRLDASASTLVADIKMNGGAAGYGTFQILRTGQTPDDITLFKIANAGTNATNWRWDLDDVKGTRSASAYPLTDGAMAAVYLSDVVSITDSYARQITVTMRPTDTVSISDSVSRFKTISTAFHANLADGGGSYSSSVYGTPTGTYGDLAYIDTLTGRVSQRARFATDSLTITDTIVRALFGFGPGTIQDTVAVADALYVNVHAHFRTITLIDAAFAIEEGGAGITDDVLVRTRPIPIPVPRGGLPIARWRIVAYDPHGQPVGVVQNPIDPKLLLTLNQIDSATFSLPLEDPVATGFDAPETRIKVWRSVVNYDGTPGVVDPNRPIFAGKIATIEEDGTADTVTVTAFSPLYDLQFRYRWRVVVDTDHGPKIAAVKYNLPIKDLIWALIDYTNGRGPTGIARGALTGAEEPFPLTTDNSQIWQLISDIITGSALTGVDVGTILDLVPTYTHNDGDPTLMLLGTQSARGSYQPNSPLHYHVGLRNCVNMTRTFTIEPDRNADLVRADSQGLFAERIADTAGGFAADYPGIQGLYELHQEYNDVTTYEFMKQQALLGLKLALPPTIIVQPELSPILPPFFGRDFGIGDVLPVVANRGRMSFQGNLRCYAAELALSRNMNESCTLTLAEDRERAIAT